MTETYPNTKLHIGGKWVDAVGGETIDVINPATGRANWCSSPCKNG